MRFFRHESAPVLAVWTSIVVGLLLVYCCCRFPPVEWGGSLGIFCLTSVRAYQPEGKVGKLQTFTVSLGDTPL